MYNLIYIIHSKSKERVSLTVQCCKLDDICRVTKVLTLFIITQVSCMARFCYSCIYMLATEKPCLTVGSICGWQFCLMNLHGFLALGLELYIRDNFPKLVGNRIKLYISSVNAHSGGSLCFLGLHLKAPSHQKA